MVKIYLIANHLEKYISTTCTFVDEHANYAVHTVFKGRKFDFFYVNENTRNISILIHYFILKLIKREEEEQQQHRFQQVLQYQIKSAVKISVHKS